MTVNTEETNVEDLINEIQVKTGLSTDKVLEVVTMVADYMRNALPEDLVVQVTTYLGEAAASPGDAASGAVTSATDLASKAAGSTAAVFGSVVNGVSDMMPTSDEK